jgi:hypothetical protein
MPSAARGSRFSEMLPGRVCHAESNTLHPLYVADPIARPANVKRRLKSSDTEAEVRRSRRE